MNSLLILFLYVSLTLFKPSDCNDNGNIRFCSIGMGVFGKTIAKVAIEKGFKMVSVFTRYSHHTKTAGELLHMTEDQSLSFLVSDINKLEDIIDETKPHFCIDATNSTLKSVYPHFVKLIEKHIHILTLVDDAVYPHSQCDLDAYQLFQSLDRMAQQNNVVIIGGGYSDSILIPVIPSIAASMQSLTKIHLTQKENIDDWGDFAHHSEQYGVGLTQKQFKEMFNNDIDTGIENWQRRIVESIVDGINNEILKVNDDNTLQIYTKKECYVVENENGLYSKVINKSIAFNDCAGMNTTVFAKVSNNIEIVFSVIFAVIPNIDNINDIQCIFFGAHDSNVQFSIKNVDGKMTTAVSLIHRVRSVLNELKSGFYNVARMKANKYWKSISEFE